MLKPKITLYLQSIEPLARENIISTQTKPILVHASDLNFYYCKYHTGSGSAYRLFKEYLIGSFVGLWELNHASHKFINIAEEHVPADLGIQKRFFLSPCFGSKRIPDTVVLSKLNEDVLLKSKGKQRLKSDLLNMSFFDMVFANEDRHQNNYNILYSQVRNEYILYAIDHEACFNHSNIDRGMSILTYEETLIYTTLFRKLYNKYELNDKKSFAELKGTYYLRYRSCIDKIDEILSSMPKEWNIDILLFGGRLKSYLTDDWFKECWNNYILYLQLFMSNTQ